MGINGKGVAMESSEQLVKGLGWVGLTLLVAGFVNFLTALLYTLY